MTPPPQHPFVFLCVCVLVFPNFRLRFQEITYILLVSVRGLIRGRRTPPSKTLARLRAPYHHEPCRPTDAKRKGGVRTILSKRSRVSGLRPDPTTFLKFSAVNAYLIDNRDDPPRYGRSFFFFFPNSPSQNVKHRVWKDKPVVLGRVCSLARLLFFFPFFSSFTRAPVVLVLVCSLVS